MTLRDLVARSLRLLRVYGSGVQPTAEEATDGLNAFITMALSWVRYGLLTEVLISANYTAGEDERITITSGSPTITLPTSVTDADTGEARPPRDGATVAQVGATPKVSIYSGARGAWVDINALTLNSTTPFGPELDEALAALLAIRLQPEYGGAITDAVAALAQLGQGQIDARLTPPVTASIDPQLVCHTLADGYWLQ